MQTREMRFYLHSLNSSSFFCLSVHFSFFMMMHIAVWKFFILLCIWLYVVLPREPFNFHLNERENFCCALTLDKATFIVLPLFILISFKTSPRHASTHMHCIYSCKMSFNQFSATCSDFIGRLGWFWLNYAVACQMSVKRLFRINFILDKMLFSNPLQVWNIFLFLSFLTVFAFS